MVRDAWVKSWLGAQLVRRLQHRWIPWLTRDIEKDGRGRNPDHAGIFARIFDLCTVRLTAGEAVTSHVLLAEIIEVIVISYRLDSEQFRSVPRT
jgi:hypothetical protein